MANIWIRLGREAECQLMNPCNPFKKTNSGDRKPFVSGRCQLCTCILCFAQTPRPADPSCRRHRSEQWKGRHEISHHSICSRPHLGSANLQPRHCLSFSTSTESGEIQPMTMSMKQCIWTYCIPLSDGSLLFRFLKFVRQAPWYVVVASRLSPSFPHSEVPISRAQRRWTTQLAVWISQ